jgi:hypothetical protein
VYPAKNRSAERTIAQLFGSLPESKHEARFKNTARLVRVQASGSERRTRRHVSGVDNRKISA